MPPEWDLVAQRGAQGVQGPTGPTGPVGMDWEDTYVTGTFYNVDEVVQFNGSSFIAVNAGYLPAPPAPSPDVTTVTGATGPTGAAGAAGPGINLVRVIDYNPTGTADDTTQVQAAATAAAGKTLVFTAERTYTINPATPILIPDNTYVWIMRGATILMKPNVATGAGIFRLFAPVSATPTDISFQIDGLLDGNKRNGNHGASEDIAGLWFSDITRFRVFGAGRFYNFRSEAIYSGHASVISNGIHIHGFDVEDCGVPVGGDANVNARQGIAFIAAKDVLGHDVNFKSIGAYAWDFEGNGAGDNFDNINIGPNTYRDVGSGAVNVTTPGTATNINVLDDPIAGTTPPVAYAIPTAQKRAKTVRRVTGNIQFVNTAWAGLAASAIPPLTASMFDIVLPAKPNDIIEISMSAGWVDLNAANGALDVVTLDGGGAVVNFLSTATPGGSDYGIAALQGIISVRSAVGGTVQATLGAADVVNGFVTLRPYCRVDAVATSRTISGTQNAGAGPPFQFTARNLGAQG